MKTGPFTNSFLLLMICLLVMGNTANAQDTLNYEESKIPPYKLPDPLLTDDGKHITSPAEWETIQRPAILKKYVENIYGRIPGKPKDIHYKVVTINKAALNGKATQKEITIYFTKGDAGPSMVVLLYLPNNIKGKAPVFIGLNFTGNHAAQSDPNISITPNWKKINTNNAPTLKNQWPVSFGWAPALNNKTPVRGEEQHRWPVEALIDNGYGLATAYYEDLEPDNPDGWKTGIRTTLQHELNISPGEWGSISAWAWGLSRMMDYLETDQKVNPQQVIVTGLSRLGKTALWAGANDQRFAIVVSNNSGETGAALSKRIYGETIELINKVNPHWCVARYKSYNSNADKLPVDQHMLIALAAPRPIYIASAVLDKPADPNGEFLSGKFAGPVYSIYGRTGVGVEQQPAVDHPVGDFVGYHVRSGGHDILLYDWQQFMQFANRHFKAALH